MLMSCNDIFHPNSCRMEIFRITDISTVFVIVQISIVSQINGLSPSKSRFTLHDKGSDSPCPVHIYLAHIFY